MQLYVLFKYCKVLFHPKMLRYMKFTAMLLLAFGLHVSAKSTGQNISLEAHHEPLAKVMNEIKKQTGYSFFFNQQWLEQSKPVDMRVKNMPLAEVLKRCFAGQPFYYAIVNKTIVLKLKPATEHAAPAPAAIDAHDVRICVRDSLGNPLAGATVFISNVKKGGQTDSNGCITLTGVQDDATLIVSYVGYVTQRVGVNGRSAINVALKLEQRAQENVVVVYNTGYQAMAKERSTGSFSVIESDDILQKSGSMNAIDRLEGLAPGLSFNYGQGNDKILMRGVSSVNLDRQPLIILDGVPVAEYKDIESLVNPADIQNVTLLKDATAASIWGAQAANGVIVITTKSGQFNDSKLNISYNGFVSFKGLPDQSSLNLMSSSEFIGANKALFNTQQYADAFPYSTVSTGLLPKIYPHEQVYYDQKSGAITEAIANSRWDSLAGLSNQGQINKDFYRRGLLSAHSISVSGGGKFNRFFSSLSYSRENGMDRSTSDHYLINLKEEMKLAKWLTFDVTGNLSYEKRHQLFVSLPKGMTLNNYLPYAMFATNGGRPLSQSYLNFMPAYQQSAEQKSGISLNYIPLDELDRNKNSQSSIASRVNAGLRFNLLKGLTYSFRGQYQKTVDDGYNFYDASSFPVRLENTQFTQAPSTPTGSPTYFLPTTGGHYSTNNTKVTSWTVRNQLDYNNKIGTDHQIVALGGVEMRSSLYDITNTLTRGYNFQTETYTNYNQKDLETTGISRPVLPIGNASANKLTSFPLTKAESELRFLSYYGNLAYTFKGRYNFNGSLRYDQSNLFGKASSSQNKPIWSAGLSWNLEKEDFFRSGIFTKLTPRITYGIAGNSPKPGLGGAYDVLYAVSSPMFDQPGYIIISPANNQLSWELTKIFNAGLDFELLDHRISGSIDYYNKQTRDLLGDNPVDPTTGWYSYYGNIGNLYNKGIEFSVTSNNIITSQFSWTTKLNLSYNKNKVTLLKRYTPLVATSLVNGGFVEGYSAYSLFAYNYKGLDANGNPVAIKADGTTVSLTNQLINDDILYQGTTQPLWYGGITNTFFYKRFSLSGLIVFNLGNVMRANVNQVYSGRLLTNISKSFEDRWKQSGDENKTNVPKYIANESTSLSERSTDLYTKGNVNTVSGSYMKLRDLTLAYSFPISSGIKNAIKKIKVYGQINNIMLWTKNSDHIDPEYYNLSTGTPLPKMPAYYTLGVNVDL